MHVTGWRTVAACVALVAQSIGASDVLAEPVSRWRDLVSHSLDTLIISGTDRYGAVQSDMFVAILDVQTHKSPENPLWLDSEAYYEPGRSHRRSLAGANFWYDQETLRAMYRLSASSGDGQYASAANRAIGAFFDNTIRSTGMPAWGTHVYYNVFTDQPDGDGGGTGPHETLVYDAQWNRLYAEPFPGRPGCYWFSIFWPATWTGTVSWAGPIWISSARSGGNRFRRATCSTAIRPATVSWEATIWTLSARIGAKA